MMHQITMEKLAKDGDIMLIKQSVKPRPGGMSDGKSVVEAVKKEWRGRVDIVVMLQDNDIRAASDCMAAIDTRTPAWIDYRVVVFCNTKLLDDRFFMSWLPECDMIVYFVAEDGMSDCISALRGAQREIDTDWVVFVDQHVVVTEGWLENILSKILQSVDNIESRVGVVVPWTTKRIIPSAGSNYLDMAERLRNIPQPIAFDQAFLSDMSCFAISRELLSQVDSEEFDLSKLNKKYLMVRAGGGYVLDETEEHKCLLKRTIGAHGDKVEEAASRIFGVESNRPQVVFCFQEIGLVGAVLAVSHICNHLIELGWNASFAFTRLLPSYSMRHIPMRFTPYGMGSAQGIIRELRGKLSDACVVATMWSTVNDVVNVCRGREDLVPVYFVQDDERRFRYPDVGGRTGKPYTKRETIEGTYKMIETKVVNSEWVGEELRVLGHDAHKIGIGVDTLMFRPTRKPGDWVRVMAHCRPSTPRRGWSFIRDVVNAVAMEGKEFEFVTFDEEPASDDLCVSRHVTLGRVSPSELARHMGATHVFVEGSEVQGWGMQGLEAMSCGCALVSTDNGGILNYGTRDKDCVIVQHGNVQEAAQAICRLIDDAEERERLGNNARFSALEFGWEIVAGEWDRFLREQL